jgi:hypothetical protein
LDHYNHELLPNVIIELVGDVFEKIVDDSVIAAPVSSRT